MRGLKSRGGMALQTGDPRILPLNWPNPASVAGAAVRAGAWPRTVAACASPPNTVSATCVEKPGGNPACTAEMAAAVCQVRRRLNVSAHPRIRLAAARDWMPAQWLTAKGALVGWALVKVA